MKITREIKTAILVITSILLFIWGYSFLKGKDLFNKYKTFYVEYANVEGLAPSAPVTINGLNIGIVKTISIKENGTLLAELQINTEFPISKSSVATIYDASLIGGKQVAIHPNFEDKNVAESGDYLKGDIDAGLMASLGDKMSPVMVKVEKLMASADKLITSFNNVMDEKGQADLKKTLSELSATMEQFHKVAANANGILDENKGQLKNVVSNFNKVSDNFVKISDSLNKADLGKTVKNLNSTLSKVDGLMKDMEAGKGTMGKLMKDEALYKNLSQTSKELELLLEDVRLNPTRYVNVSLFGKKNKPYVAPKDSITK
ncbi:MlaD family protein [Flavobacterium gilvum]|uniref:Organic solvent ABC transporter substrate-binding protein n=1 Tax=Flavobacterium gilvum TaxID=1492737 RepID=A0AAC9I4S4_9FLAO|nr:MlaD family protein [Flavobacterium gilvum]AOW10426.1 organic solvent ABC transporter substrate-binding protein [Flavobacterium gilvum]KFC59055.1 organic solvent ABC transporter substrate-binding protein [Flavobacterium gilvum]